MPTWIVPPDTGRLRLDIFVTSKTKLPRHQVQRLIRDGNVQMDGRPAKSVHEWLRSGNKVTLQKISASKDEKVPTIVVLKKTNDYLVIAKPAGIAVHGGLGVRGLTVVDGLLKKFPEIKKIGEDPIRPGIVHRLDKPVSGCMVVACTNKMFQHLKQQFTAREVNKEYIALVYGVVKNDSGTINVPIGRSAAGRFAAHTKSQEHDRDAVTDWIVQQRFTNATLLILHPATGRTHQLRVHCKFMGHSIVGDEVYLTKKQPHHLPPLNRLFLHAAKLEFTDLDGTPVKVSCPLPPELTEYLVKIQSPKLKESKANNNHVIASPQQGAWQSRGHNAVVNNGIASSPLQNARGSSQ
jgi:23S rRNA pseudouridine1911/1915/1917 synthase